MFIKLNYETHGNTGCVFANCVMMFTRQMPTNDDAGR